MILKIMEKDKLSMLDNQASVEDYGNLVPSISCSCQFASQTKLIMHKVGRTKK